MTKLAFNWRKTIRFTVDSICIESLLVAVITYTTATFDLFGQKCSLFWVVASVKLRKA